MPTIRLHLEYDGTEFAGWQVQPGRRTVQGVLEDAIGQLTGVRTRVAGAGRTDAGVHALRQVAAVVLPEEWPAARLEKALRALLPGDLTLGAVLPAPDGFDPRRHAVRRTYRYRIGLTHAALERLRRWVVEEELDAAAMREAALRLRGEHDFTPFCVNVREQSQPVLHLDAVTVTKEAAPGELHLEFRARSFLTRMVRLLTATLVAVGRGERTPDDVEHILTSGDRGLVPSPAPPHGLYLVRVEYPGESEVGGREGG